MNENSKVHTCLWFEKGGLEAAKFYVSLLPDSRIESEYPAEDGKEPLTVEFTLAGAPYQILNGGDYYKLTPAASISVLTDDQEETDRLWSALLADGGEESHCGWIADRFGVTWQIAPRALVRAITSPDLVAAERARQAMMTMRKIDIATIEKAFNG